MKEVARRRAAPVVKTRPLVRAAYRWMVASRIVAAIAGGYALAAIATTALAMYLPSTRAASVLIATMTSFLIYVCVAIWVFAARTAWRAWLGIIVPMAALATLLLVEQGTRA